MRRGRWLDFFQTLGIGCIATLCQNFQNWTGDLPRAQVLCLLCTERNSHFLAEQHLLSEIQQLAAEQHLLSEIQQLA